MTPFHTVLLASALAVAGVSAQAAEQVRIDCGDIDVILQEDQAQTVAEVRAINDMTGPEFAATICEIFSGFDPADYEKAKAVTISHEGRQLEAEIEASKQ